MAGSFFVKFSWLLVSRGLSEDMLKGRVGVEEGWSQREEGVDLLPQTSNNRHEVDADYRN